jgi:DNA repair exonuclease SbcCD ATPase subunit
LKSEQALNLQNLITLIEYKKVYEDAKLKLDNIQNLIKLIDISAEKEKLDNVKRKIKESEKEFKDYKSKSDKLVKTIEKLDNEITFKKENLDIYTDLITQQKILSERIVWENDTKKEISRQIKVNSKQLDKLDEECTQLNSIIKNITVLSDYLNYTKTLCKDENAKQFAISFIMPYLTKQINHYLSKSEINYYINLNNVMDEEIKGPGVYNAGYGNLSGGEGKSIDLAILFSLLDISRLQLGVFPSLLMLDELLDTSVDKIGLDGILKILYQRQKDDDSTIFLITHRSDVSELNGMRTYCVEKNDGFSNISEIES